MPSFHSPGTPSLPSSQISQPQRISNSSVLRDPPVAALPLALPSRGVGYFLLLDGTTQDNKGRSPLRPFPAGCGLRQLAWPHCVLGAARAGAPGGSEKQLPVPSSGFCSWGEAHIASPPQHSVVHREFPISGI